MKKTAVSNAAEKRNITVTRRGAAREREQGRVLVVDDDLMMLKQIRRQLSGRWTVDTAVGATTAAGMMGDGSYDAVITDYNMPGRDGLWLLKWVRAKQPAARRILLSSEAPGIFAGPMVSGLVQRYVAKAPDLCRVEEALDELI